MEIKKKGELTAQGTKASQRALRKNFAFFARPLRSRPNGMAGRALRLGFWPFCFLLASCQKPGNNNPAPSGNYQHGVWFIDEGLFTAGNAGLDFYHLDKDTLETNVFQNINGKPLGDVLESMYHYNGHYYLVVNGSNEVLVVDDKTLKVSTVIPYIVYPRYFLPVSNQKAYVTDNTNEGINIIDLQTNTVAGKITYDPKPNPDSAYASWTEQMVQYHSNVFVAAVKTGKLLIINSITDKITDTISLSIGLKDLVMDAQNRIWALCDGTLATPYINSRLFCLDTTGKILKSYTFPDPGTGTGNLTINATDDTLFYIHSGVYKLGINQNSLSSSSIIDGTGHDFYGLGVNPLNSDIYVGDALNFTQPGIVFQYNSAGKLLKTHHCGVGPNGFLFVN